MAKPNADRWSISLRMTDEAEDAVRESAKADGNFVNHHIVILLKEALQARKEAQCSTPGL